MIWLPEKIQKAVEGKPYTENNVGMSGAKIFQFEDMVLKVGKMSFECENERTMCDWFHGEIPVPEIFEQEIQNGICYTLMSRVSGKMLCDECYMKNPELLLETAAAALKTLWSADIDGCPLGYTLDRKLELARENVERGLVDVENVEPETFGPGGFKDPAALLRWLEDNRPEEEPVLTHGDFCLPNIFARESAVTGFIDCGKMGVSDKWQDIAIAIRSIRHNFEGKYNGGVAYADFDADRFLEKLSVEHDERKERYYFLLDELF